MACPVCNGSGKVTIKSNFHLLCGAAMEEIEVECYGCDGSGREITEIIAEAV